MQPSAFASKVGSLGQLGKVFLVLKVEREVLPQIDHVHSEVIVSQRSAVLEAAFTAVYQVAQQSTSTYCLHFATEATRQKNLFLLLALFALRNRFSSHPKCDFGCIGAPTQAGVSLSTLKISSQFLLGDKIASAKLGFRAKSMKCGVKVTDQMPSSVLSLFSNSVSRLRTFLKRRRQQCFETSDLSRESCPS